MRLISSAIYRMKAVSWFFMILLVLAGCSPGDDLNDTVGQLTEIARYSLDFGDPSGLALDPDHEHLWSVNDKPGGGIYKIDMQGEIVKHIPMDSDDLEGIIVDPRDSTLWVAEERLRELVNISREGEELNRVFLDISGEIPNDGLEGITVNPNNNHFFVVNERNPRLLIELNPEMEIINKTEINFSGAFEMGDLSAISYNNEEDTLWILSDRSEKIVVTSLSGEPKRVYLTGVNDGEGLAVWPEQRLVFVCSDEDSELYIFSYE